MLPSKTESISKQILISTFLSLFLCMSIIQSTFANPSDSLIVAFHHSKNVDERLDIAISFTRLNISTPNICFPILRKAIGDSSKAKNGILVGKALRTLGVLHYYQANLDSSLYYY